MKDPLTDYSGELKKNQKKTNNYKTTTNSNVLYTVPYLQQIKLHSTFSVDDLVLSLAHLFRLEHGLLHPGLGVTDTTQVCKF